jgi:hypothetical protein
VASRRLVNFGIRGAETGSTGIRAVCGMFRAKSSAARPQRRRGPVPGAAGRRVAGSWRAEYALPCVVQRCAGFDSLRITPGARRSRCGSIRQTARMQRPKATPPTALCAAPTLSRTGRSVFPVAADIPKRGQDGRAADVSGACRRCPKRDRLLRRARARSRGLLPRVCTGPGPERPWRGAIGLPSPVGPTPARHP